METMDVRCPWCSATLKIRKMEGMESKNLTCPVCKKSSPFREYKTFVISQDESVTQMPGIGIRTKGEGKKEKENLIIGKLIIAGGAKSFQLMAGRNVVGRNSLSSQADIKIDAGNRMSREHVVIEVTHFPGKGFQHFISLFKEMVNPTYLNSTELVYGDKLILQNRDIIKLPDVDVLFEIPYSD